jgi:hypothetical protein
MKDRLIALLEVRKLISLMAIMLFVYLSVVGVLELVFIQNIIIMVISYYFGKATALDVQDPRDKQDN